MVHLSEIFDEVENGHREIGFVINEAACHHFFEGTKTQDEEKLLTGLLPERILLNDNWKKHIKRIEFEQICAL